MSRSSRLDFAVSVAFAVALGIETVFGVSANALMRMQTSYDIAEARKREGDIDLVPFQEQFA